MADSRILWDRARKASADLRPVLRELWPLVDLAVIILNYYTPFYRRSQYAHHQGYEPLATVGTIAGVIVMLYLDMALS